MLIKSDFKNKDGYTLIEILTVVSVIGLIAAAAFVSLSNAREKARISRGLKFASEIYQGLGAEAVGVWTLDEGSGANANDGSGYNNHGTLTNGPTWSTDTPSGKGYSLIFDGSDDSINFGNPNKLNITGSLTVSAWVKPTVAIGAEKSFVTKYGSGYEWALRTSLDKPRFTVDYPNGTDFNVNGTTALSPNSWWHLVGIYDDKLQKIYIYVNGKLENTADGPVAIAAGSSNVIAGAQSRAGFNFNGLIDDIRVYTSALSSAQIKKYYAEGFGKHNNLAANE